jgi:hypothetical protein
MQTTNLDRALCFGRRALCGALLSLGFAVSAADWDNFSDTWVATDALGRRLPDPSLAGPPRADRTVGLFYFLWHGAHIQGGPYDVTRILAEEPGAMKNPASSRWGPLHAPHHWGESLFGYYLADDAGVLRKHAQMLSDAGVDMVVFDVTNQVTYPEWYRALLREWSAWRLLGNRTPQVAFLTPFWDPAKVTRELWHDLYEPGLHPDLWFRWDGKPLLLADPDLIDAREDHAQQNTPVELEPGRTLGQSFVAEKSFRAVGGRFPNWRSPDAAVTLTLFKHGPGGERVVAERFHRTADNAWLQLRPGSTLPPGRYYLEASEPDGRVGWWSHTDDTNPKGEAFANGTATRGDRTLRLVNTDDEADRIRAFFTFRKPQPDYFQGPTRSNMWSWLEVHPQHVFRNDRGEKEQMSVGVGQNAVGGRLGSMSEAGSRGRSWHAGSQDPRPGAVRLGLNVEEQWTRALAEDPRFVFITGWNEWIAGRFAEFNGIKEPVMFVDQFDQEHSRDIEPMKGGHGDDYYWQMVSWIRRYKGVREVPPVESGRIRIDGRFSDWEAVRPEFRDTRGDPVRREHRGWSTNTVYADRTGRNDLIAAKVSADSRRVNFLARAAGELSAPSGGSWMVLWLDVDADPATGWLGYDYAVNRIEPGSLERHAGGAGFQWQRVGSVPWKALGTDLELSVRWRQLGQRDVPSAIDFKWSDHAIQTGEWSDFTLHGDAAPNDRFNYRAQFPRRR